VNERTTYDSHWCAVEEGFALEKSKSYESLFALGTGYLTVRSSLEEGFFDDDQSRSFERFMGNTTLEKMRSGKAKWGSYMTVVQARHPHLMRGIVNLPYFLGLVIYADGEKLDMEVGRISGYERWLNFKTATLYRSFVWETRAGKKLEMIFVRFMDPKQKFVCVQECRLRMLSGVAEIAVSSFVDNDVRTNGFDMFVETEVGRVGDLLISKVRTNANDRIVTACSTGSDVIASWTYEREARRMTAYGHFLLREGGEASVVKVSSVICDAYFPADTLMEKASSTVMKNAAVPVDMLHLAHIEAWRALWDEADVEVEADDREGYDSQQAIRYAVYHLLRAKAADEERGALCPKGTTAETYFGSVFWDTDIFHMPYYAYTNPPAARSQIMYRYRNLEAARRIAEGYGYPGARYPWQSDVDGEETCVLWQYADHQVHITADVAVALWHYYRATDDVEFLFDYGAEMLIETARYWTARVDEVPGRAGYQILGVMGPDEYKPLTNNNAYTNYVARLNLRLAAEVSDLMKARVPEKWRALTGKLDYKDTEAALFRKIAEGISIPIDEERGIVLQCDDFDTAFAELDIDGIWKDRSRLFGTYVSQEKRYRSKCMKQADVVALLAVFGGDFPPTVKRASFEYNAKYCIHDSSNSMSHHSMVAGDIGHTALAYEYWLGAIRIDFWKEARSSDGIHMTNVAGMWQAISFGFCGMSSALNSDTLSFDPRLPAEMKRIRFKAQWKGLRFEVEVGKAELRIKNLSESALEFIVRGEARTAAPGSQAEVKL
jgi:trehalose/maltose hydrolase-like predicted phosphorylase